MTYYLRHHFDPFFDHTNLSPAAKSHGKVDHYCLGYVQNVVKGQIVAEIIEVPTPPTTVDGKFILETPTFPVGPNTHVNPENSKQLLATHNGYIFYHNGLISVKKLLTVHGSIDFHTGNVLFINDLCVEGTVRSGFEIQGRNILVKDTVEGAKIKAHNNITAQSGIKGAKLCEIDAGETIKTTFCENCTLSAGADIFIEGSSLHSRLSLNGKLVVKERLQGGKVYANNMVYVGDQLGGGINTSTTIVMGYPPKLVQKVSMIEEKIDAAEDKIKNLREISAKSDLHKAEHAASLLFEEKRMNAFRRELRRVMKLMQEKADTSLCRIIVPGMIRPGVEISIGKHYIKINDYLENVAISLRDDELVFESPAISKK